jgi:cytochrome c oxidase cbb3-type subunit 1
LVPKLAGRPLHSVAMANLHFWLALAGILLYIISMWGAGLSQSLLWLSLDDLGEVRYSFVDVVAAMAPYYMLRLVGGLLFLSGALLMAENLRRTFLGTRTVTVEPPVSIATPVLAPAQRVAMSPVNEP